jgi:hypothetical protein
MPKQKFQSVYLPTFNVSVGDVTAVVEEKNGRRWGENNHLKGEEYAERERTC